MNEEEMSGLTHEAEEYYFEYSASLRIFGESIDLNSISERLGIEPTHAHRKGDPRPGLERTWSKDMWYVESGLPSERPLGDHLEALWKKFHEKREILLTLKNEASVDVFLGFRSNCDSGGVEIPSGSLTILTELEIPFSLSIVIG